MCKLYILLLMFLAVFTIAWDNKRDFYDAFTEKLNALFSNFDEIDDDKFLNFFNKNKELFKEYNKFCEYDKNDVNAPWKGIIKELYSFKNTIYEGYDTFFCTGPNKPVSYLPIEYYFPDERLKDAIKKWAEEMKYETYLTSQPALWIFDPISLKNLLTSTENLKLLEENNITPKNFIEEINKTNKFSLAGNNPKMYQLIARAFGREISLDEVKELMKKFK